MLSALTTQSNAIYRKVNHNDDDSDDSDDVSDCVSDGVNDDDDMKLESDIVDEYDKNNEVNAVIENIMLVESNTEPYDIDSSKISTEAAIDAAINAATATDAAADDLYNGIIEQLNTPHESEETQTVSTPECTLEYTPEYTEIFEPRPVVIEHSFASPPEIIEEQVHAQVPAQTIVETLKDAEALKTNDEITIVAEELIHKKKPKTIQQKVAKVYNKCAKYVSNLFS